MVSGGVRGTLPWMAPELLNGSSNKVSEKVSCTYQSVKFLQFTVASFAVLSMNKNFLEFSTFLLLLFSI